MSTKTDVGATEWRIDDEPFRVRRWASDAIHLLPTQPDQEVIVGSDEGSNIRLVDEEGLISGRHASIRRDRGRLTVRDLESKNGTWVDRSRRVLSLLEPGSEIVVGKVTLVAESARFVELRELVSRLLGWGPERLESVDLALRAIRTSAARRAPLVLCGDGQLPALAAQIHRRTFGDERPFVVADPRRESAEATVRSAQNYKSGLDAIKAARGGTVCMWATRLPRDHKAMMAAWRDPATRVQIIVCAGKPADGKAFEVIPIDVPPLSSRIGELSRIIDEYERDARTLLSVEQPLNALDREWILDAFAATLPDIEKATMRFVAKRKTGSDNAAADLLGMSHTSFGRWFKRRRRKR